MSSNDRPDRLDRPKFKESLGESASEVRQFVASLKGKSPAEAMGAIAQSHLARSVLLATALLVGFILIFTIPYAIFGNKAKPAAAPATQPTTAPTTQPLVAPVMPPPRTEPRVSPDVLRQDVPKANEKRRGPENLLDDLK